MPDRPPAAVTTILFTDLVKSTELIQRVGDEQAQRIFAARHNTLITCLAAHRGEELQWEGDRLMAAFASAGDAVRCAIAMQRAALQPVLGQRLELRVGLNAGEILRQEIGSGHFGTPVVVASRLCDRAEAGQILVGSVVPALLSGRHAFRFHDLGAAELKGIEAPVGVAEVVYEAESPSPFIGKAPFVGRGAEMGRLFHTLERTVAGAGGLVFAVGEPGIGKTRMLEEFAAQARTRGARVLWGRCYEGEGARPYAPFAEALEDYLRRTNPEELRNDLGLYGAAIEAMAPSLRACLPDLVELPRLEPDEERTRLFDALTQFLLATAERAPVLLVLDDVHWADRTTIALLRYVARFAVRGRLLLLGAYRDVELARQHPLADALAVLKREVEYERIALKGLPREQVGELLEAIAAREVPAAFVEAMSAETNGNPFFIREILLHLVEEGRLYRAEGRWTTDLSIEKLGIPEGVRHVIGRRLSRLSEKANGLLRAGSGFDKAFRLDVVTRVAELDEPAALDALDEALDAQLVRPGGDAETYEFTHTLIRHTLYRELNPARQVRLHRRIAEEMERAYGERADDRAAEIARHYHRSAVLPGAERGVTHCLAAADRAQRAAAHDDVVSSLRMALDLLPEDDPRRTSILARLGLALALSFSAEDAVSVATEAAEMIAKTDGGDVAADYLFEVVYWVRELNRLLAWPLVEKGLSLLAPHRNLTWALLLVDEIERREALDPGFPGIALDCPERREISQIVFEGPRPAIYREPNTCGSAPKMEAGVLRRIDRERLRGNLPLSDLVFESREEVFQKAGESAFHLAFLAGDYQKGLSLYREQCESALRRGEFTQAALWSSQIARLESALGRLGLCKEALDRTSDLARRMAIPHPLPLAAVASNAVLVGDPLEPLVTRGEAILEEAAPSHRPVMAVTRAYVAYGNALIGRTDRSFELLKDTLPAIERAPGWASNYTWLIHLVVDAMWTLDRTEFAPTLEANLRRKTLGPDFRYPHADGRLSLARLLALQGRFNDALDWFSRARAVLREQGARPLCAIADYDEGLMYMRRGGTGDHERGLTKLELALDQFREIGMRGLIARAEALLRGESRAEH